MFEMLFKEIEIDSLFGLKSRKKRGQTKATITALSDEFSLSEKDALRVPILTSEVKRAESPPVVRPIKQPLQQKVSKEATSIQYDRGIDFAPETRGHAESPQQRVLEVPVISDEVPLLLDEVVLPSDKPRVAVYGSQTGFLSGVGAQLGTFSSEFQFVVYTAESLEQGLADEQVVAWIVRLSEEEEDMRVLDELDRIAHPQVLYVLDDRFDDGSLQKCHQFLQRAVEAFDYLEASQGNSSVRIAG